MYRKEVNLGLWFSSYLVQDVLAVTERVARKDTPRGARRPRGGRFTARAKEKLELKKRWGSHLSDERNVWFGLGVQINLQSRT